MKKLLLILLTTLLLSCSADETKRVSVNGCNCRVEYYLGAPPVGGGSLQYTFQFSEPIDYDCTKPFGNYYLVSNANYNYAKVVCE